MEGCDKLADVEVKAAHNGKGHNFYQLEIMVNTVGSCETKYWQKKWIKIKEKIKLTSKQKLLIVGSLLGDATMAIGKKGRNANLKIEHCLVQKEYVEWKYSILKPLVFTGPKLSYRYDENGRKYPKSWWFRTIRHPELTEIYKKFYSTNVDKKYRKRVPEDIYKFMTPLSLAVWIMDDGSYNKGRIDISTYSFIYSEIQTLHNCLCSVFDVHSRFYKDRKGWRMYFSKEETHKLIKIISPYVIPSMKYKIGFATP